MPYTPKTSSCSLFLAPPHVCLCTTSSCSSVSSHSSLLDCWTASCQKPGHHHLLSQSTGSVPPQPTVTHQGGTCSLRPCQTQLLLASGHKGQGSGKGAVRGQYPGAGFPTETGLKANINYSHIPTIHNPLRKTGVEVGRGDVVSAVNLRKGKNCPLPGQQENPQALNNHGCRTQRVQSRFKAALAFSPRGIVFQTSPASKHLSLTSSLQHTLLHAH